MRFPRSLYAAYLILLSPASLAYPALTVTLQKIDEVPPQDFGNGIAAPISVNGSVLYAKTDDNDTSGASYGIVDIWPSIGLPTFSWTRSR